MKNFSILYLKAALVLVVLPTLALAGYGLYFLFNNPANPDYATSLYPIVIGLYLSLIPFYYGVYKTWQILSHVRKGSLHSSQSAKDFKAVRLSAVVIGAIFILTEPFVFMVAQLDDAPGLVIFGMIPVFIAGVILAVFTVFQRLLNENPPS